MKQWYWTVDPKSGDYVMEGGSPKLSNSLVMPARVRLRAHRTQWMYAPDTNWGSDFYALKKTPLDQQVNTGETTAARALQPIIDDGRASQIDINAVVSKRGALGLKVDIFDAQGDVETLNLPGIF